MNAESNKSQRMTNVLLAGIAGLLGINLIVQSGGAGLGATAHADPAAPVVSLNSSEFQRRAADGIAELNQRIARMEGRFDRVIQVKITESVPLTVTGLGGDKADQSK